MQECGCLISNPTQMNSAKGFSRSVSVESLLDELSLKAQLIFEHLDTQGRGFLEPWQLVEACDTKVNEEDMQAILVELDADGDGLISFRDFEMSFQKIVRRQSFYCSSDCHLTSCSDQSRLNSSASSSSKSGRPSLCELVEEDNREDVFETANLQRRASVFRRIKARARKRQLLRRRSSSTISVLESLGRSEIFKCQEEITELRWQLGKDSPSLQQLFDRVMAEVVSVVRRLRDENLLMERTIDAERNRHMEEISRLTEELEREIAAVESKANEREQEALLYETGRSVKKQVSCSLEDILKDCQDSPRKKGCDTGSLTSDVRTRGKLTLEDLEIIRHKIFLLRWQKSTAESDVKELRAQLQSARIEIAALRCRQDASAQELVAHSTAINELLLEKNQLAIETSQLKEMNKRLSGITDDLVAALETNTPVSVTSNPYLQTSISLTSLCDTFAKDDDLSQTMSIEIDEKPFSNDNTFTDSGHWSPKATLDARSDISCTESLQTAALEAMEWNNQIPIENQGDTAAPLSNGSTQQSRRVGLPKRQSDWRKSLTESIRRSISRSRRCSTSSAIIGDAAATSNSGNVERVSVYKVMLAGDSAVGKTSFVLRLCGGQFYEATSPTIGIDMKTKEIDLDNERTILQLWDTAGQERFQSMTTSFFRKADAILLMYACDNEESFLNARHWMTVIKEATNSGVPVLLVANKIDVRIDGCASQVTSEQGRQLFKECGADFIEVSAKSGTNVDECAVKLIRQLRSSCQRLEPATSGLVKLEAALANQNRKAVHCCRV